MKRLFYTNEKVDNRMFQYFLGFQPSDGWLLYDDETQHGLVFLDARYIAKEIRITHTEQSMRKILLDKPFTDVLGDVLQEYGFQKEQKQTIVIEKSLPYGVWEYLVAWAQEQWNDDIFVCEEKSWQRMLRVHKSGADIGCIQTAIKLTKEIWSRIEKLAISGALIGKTERELRGMIINKAYSLGLEGEAFDTIVATGANSAIPHHTSGNTLISSGPLLIDMGFRRHGWCSDMTRCIWLESDDKSLVSSGMQEHVSKEEFEKVMNIVIKAHNVAKEMVAVGVLFKDIAQAARDVIDAAGYGTYFTHALGHGVGLDVHEAPSVSIKSSDVIAPGMVFTIEPGIYVPGKFGVRRENIVVV